MVDNDITIGEGQTRLSQPSTSLLLTPAAHEERGMASDPPSTFAAAEY